MFLAVLVIMLPVTLAEELNLQIDANGNLVTGYSFYREYNELNQLVRIREGNISTGPILEEYIWHPLEERILVKDVFSNGVKNYSIYYVNDNYILIENSSGNYSEKYLYIDDQLVAFVDTDGNKRFVHSDHLGSVSLITDINGNVVEESFYSPFGEIIEGGKNSRFDYEGKEYDSSTQTYDFHFRQINPSVPVWQKPDTLIQNVYDPQSLNRYSFERSNPINSVDPTGHIAWYLAIPLATVIGAGLGATYELGRQTYAHFSRGESFSGAGITRAAAVGGAIGFASAVTIVTLGAVGISGTGVSYAVRLTYGFAGNAELTADPSDMLKENKPEPKEVRTEEDLKCGLVVDCQLQAIEGQGQPQGTSSVSSASPSKSQPSSQTNSASSVNPRSSSTSTGKGGGGYVAGVGYVTPEGRIYPTNNPDWKPNPNAPKYTPPPPKPKSSKGGKK